MMMKGEAAGFDEDGFQASTLPVSAYWISSSSRTNCIVATLLHVLECVFPTTDEGMRPMTREALSNSRRKSSLQEPGESVIRAGKYEEKTQNTPSAVLVKG